MKNLNTDIECFKMCFFFQDFKLAKSLIISFFVNFISNFNLKEINYEDLSAVATVQAKLKINIMR